MFNANESQPTFVWVLMLLSRNHVGLEEFRITLKIIALIKVISCFGISCFGIEVKQTDCTFQFNIHFSGKKNPVFGEEESIMQMLRF